MGKKKNFYAVFIGTEIGIFQTWDECKQRTSGVSGASYHGFITREEAEKWLKEKEELVKQKLEEKRQQKNPSMDYLQQQLKQQQEQIQQLQQNQNQNQNFFDDEENQQQQEQRLNQRQAIRRQREEEDNNNNNNEDEEEEVEMFTLVDDVNGGAIKTENNNFTNQTQMLNQNQNICNPKTNNNQNKQNNEILFLTSSDHPDSFNLNSLSQLCIHPLSNFTHSIKKLLVGDFTFDFPLIEAYCDGSSLFNGTPKAVAGFGFFLVGPNHSLPPERQRSTNNNNNNNKKTSKKNSNNNNNNNSSSSDNDATITFDFSSSSKKNVVISSSSSSSSSTSTSTVVVNGGSAEFSITENDRNKFFSHGFPLHPLERQTNNRGELTACIALLAALEREESKLTQQEQREIPPILVNISTDSQYTIFGITVWIFNWYRSPGKLQKVENIDLWDTLVALVQARQIRVIQFLTWQCQQKLKQKEEKVLLSFSSNINNSTTSSSNNKNEKYGVEEYQKLAYQNCISWNYVKGHSGVYDGNAEADRLANIGSQFAQKRMFCGIEKSVNSAAMILTKDLQLSRSAVRNFKKF